MTETLYQWMNSSNFPLASALLLGILTAISPCPLATNITAIAFISKNNSEGKRKRVLLSGLLYTLGLAFTYISIALVITFGASKFHVAKFFQGNGEKYVGPIMVLVGLVMLNVIRCIIRYGFLSLQWSIIFRSINPYEHQSRVRSVVSFVLCTWRGYIGNVLYQYYCL